MTIVGNIILILLALVAAPLLGGLVAGVDRKITARFQSRFGPPILQPFYDVAKLFGKEARVINVWQAFSAYVFLLANALSVVLLFLGADMLLLFFTLVVGGVFLVMGALSAPSPYSQIGGQRELLQMLAYEPLLILVFVAVYLVTGSYNISAAFAHPTPLLFELPLIFIVLGYALTIKLRKSPFDISTCHHAHQEIVKGVTTEFSGPYLGLIEVAHWYETVLLLGLVAMFWGTNPIMALLLVVVTYLAEIVVDNVTSRMTWRWMLRYVLTAGLALSFINIVWLYAA